MLAIGRAQASPGRPTLCLRGSARATLVRLDSPLLCARVPMRCHACMPLLLTRALRSSDVFGLVGRAACADTNREFHDPSESCPRVACAWQFLCASRARRSLPGHAVQPALTKASGIIPPRGMRVPCRPCVRPLP
jgi:hypothetical protein